MNHDCRNLNTPVDDDTAVVVGDDCAGVDDNYDYDNGDDNDDNDNDDSDDDDDEDGKQR